MLPANPQHQYELDNKIFARLQIEFRSLPNGHERNPPPQTKIGPPTPLPLLILLHIFSFGLLLALTTWAQQHIRVLYFFVVLNYLLMLSSLWVLLLLLQICASRWNSSWNTVTVAPFFSATTVSSTMTQVKFIKDANFVNMNEFFIKNRLNCYFDPFVSKSSSTFQLC